MTPMSSTRGSPWPLAVAISLIVAVVALGAPMAPTAVGHR